MPSVFAEQASQIRLLMLLACQEPERFGLTICGACRRPIDKLRGIGIFVLTELSPAGKYRAVLFTLCLNCEDRQKADIGEEIAKLCRQWGHAS